MKADERRVDNHMEQVRAVHRRSAHERVLRHIRRLEGLAALADAGLCEPRREFEHEELRHLRAQRDALLAEMVEARQVPR